MVTAVLWGAQDSDQADAMLGWKFVDQQLGWTMLIRVNCV
jgi:hypothetical protein